MVGAPLVGARAVIQIPLQAHVTLRVNR